MVQGPDHPLHVNLGHRPSQIPLDNPDNPAHGLVFPKGLCPSDSPTRSLAWLARTAETALTIYEISSRSHLINLFRVVRVIRGTRLSCRSVRLQPNARCLSPIPTPADRE